MFSKACEYGIRAIVYVATQSLNNQRATLIDIAKEIDSPTAFTAKILQKLVRNKVIYSTKGPTGGFYIPKNEMHEVKLIQVVVAIDNDKLFVGCGLGLRECDESRPCPVHFKFKIIRDGLENMLKTTSIYEMAVGVDSGLSFLKTV